MLNQTFLSSNKPFCSATAKISLGKNNFIDLLRNKNQIKSIRKDLLINSINYYNKKYIDKIDIANTYTKH